MWNLHLWVIDNVENLGQIQLTWPIVCTHWLWYSTVNIFCKVCKLFTFDNISAYFSLTRVLILMLHVLLCIYISFYIVIFCHVLMLRYDAWISNVAYCTEFLWLDVDLIIFYFSIYSHICVNFFLFFHCVVRRKSWRRWWSLLLRMHKILSALFGLLILQPLQISRLLLSSPDYFSIIVYFFLTILWLFF